MVGTHRDRQVGGFMHCIVPIFSVIPMLLTPASGSDRSAQPSPFPPIVLAQAGSAGGTVGKQRKSISSNEESTEPRRSPPAQPHTRASQPAAQRQILRVHAAISPDSGVGTTMWK